MKRLGLLWLIATILVFSLHTVSHGLSSFKNLSNDPNSDENPQINDNAHVVWESWDGSNREILLHDGTSTTRIFTSTHDIYDLGVNNSGQVVWSGYPGGSGEIFFYDGTNTIVLSEEDFTDSSPQINDNGWVVWHGCDGPDCSHVYDNYEIFLYDGTSSTQLTDNAYWDGSPSISDSGYVAWPGSDGSDSEIFLYDGTSTTQLTNNEYYDGAPYVDMNNSGWVVWAMCDGGPDWWCPDGDYEIFLYDGVTTTQLTDNDYDDEYPRINNQGQVVWQGGSEYSSPYYEIFLYNGTTTTQLTDNHYWDQRPQIGDNGWVVWQAGTYDEGMGIWLYDGSTSSRITGFGLNPKINNDGWAVWYGCDRHLCAPEVYLGVPCYFNDDNDGDGYVSVACGGTDCGDFNPLVNPAMTEIPGNGHDDDCNHATPAYPEPANTIAASYGGQSLLGSGALNSLALLLIPAGGVIAWRMRRRKA